MITLSSLKNSVLLFVLFVICFGLESCVDPGLTGPRFAVKNKTDMDVTYKGFVQGILRRNQLLVSNQRTTGDEGGQLDFDSVRFVSGSDSVTYVAARLDSGIFIQQKDRSFYNLENWPKEGEDYIYSIIKADFE